jgi:hypothetical protein
MFLTPRALHALRHHAKHALEPGHQYAIGIGDFYNNGSSFLLLTLPNPQVESIAVRGICDEMPCLLSESAARTFSTIAVDWAMPPDQPEDWLCTGLRHFCTIGPSGPAPSNVSGARLSLERLKRLVPTMFDPQTSPDTTVEPIARIAAQVLSGDTRAAIVARTSPNLLVAAYSDDMDTVVILQFPAGFADEHGLISGARLLTVNLYRRGSAFASDLIPGQGNTGMFCDMMPKIAQFFSDDFDRFSLLASRIPEREWARAQQLTEFALKRGQRPRNGLTI